MSDAHWTLHWIVWQKVKIPVNLKKSIPSFCQEYPSHFEYIQSKASHSKQFISDEHIPDLLVFPPGTDLHDHPLYVSGEILLQDKVSETVFVKMKCLPVCKMRKLMIWSALNNTMSKISSVTIGKNKGYLCVTYTSVYTCGPL